MLNICDEDLVGRTLKKGDFVMNISKSYYGQRKEINHKTAEGFFAIYHLELSGLLPK